MIVSFVGHITPLRARDRRAFRSAFTRTVKAVTPTIREGCRVAFLLASLLTVLIALAALDVWIWVPHFKN